MIKVYKNIYLLLLFYPVCKTETRHVTINIVINIYFINKLSIVYLISRYFIKFQYYQVLSENL
jgi:hypothetical protein